MGTVADTRLRRMVTQAGYTPASLAEKMGLRRDGVNKRLRADIAMQDAEVHMMAVLICVPADTLMEAHRLDFQERHHGKPFRGWREWTPEDDAALTAARSRGERPMVIAKTLDRTEGSIRARMSELGLTSQRKPLHIETPVQCDTSLAPGMLVSDSHIAALYAGRRYKDVTFRRQESGQMPVRPARVSACGSTAQMCVEFAR